MEVLYKVRMTINVIMLENEILKRTENIVKEKSGVKESCKK